MFLFLNQIGVRGAELIEEKGHIEKSLLNNVHGSTLHYWKFYYPNFPSHSWRPSTSRWGTFSPSVSSLPLPACLDTPLVKARHWECLRLFEDLTGWGFECWVLYNANERTVPRGCVAGNVGACDGRLHKQCTSGWGRRHETSVHRRDLNWRCGVPLCWARHSCRLWRYSALRSTHRRCWGGKWLLARGGSSSEFYGTVGPWGRGAVGRASLLPLQKWGMSINDWVKQWEVQWDTVFHGAFHSPGCLDFGAIRGLSKLGCGGWG